jgi:transcription elongation factor Elf1
VLPGARGRGRNACSSSEEVRTMAKTERRVQVCKCDKCGNEAEMEVTCEWVTLEGEAQEKKAFSPPPAGGKGTFTCIHCGNEAEMIVDL